MPAIRDEGKSYKIVYQEYDYSNIRFSPTPLENFQKSKKISINLEIFQNLESSCIKPARRRAPPDAVTRVFTICYKMA